MRTFGPDELLACYRRGVFPMAESRHDDSLFLVDPDWRAVFPFEGFRVPRRLARTVRADGYEIRIDTQFAAVLDACAASRPGRRETWINPAIRSLYTELHKRGHAHSVEAWTEETLVGGLYGVSLGGAFFGESMFSAARDASKVALVHLIARLKAGGFRLLDAQFMTDHLAQFGAQSVPREKFHTLLADALSVEGNFQCLPLNASGAQALQSIAQTS